MSGPTPDFSDLRLVDTHAHISFPQFDNDRESVIAQIEDNAISL
ncbi:MAG TPA: TatD family deoxyribonuclease, partial [Mesotoga infera]|nr:TatD family deoxyribonuclease [Mesotoga infera]